MASPDSRSSGRPEGEARLRAASAPRGEELSATFVRLRAQRCRGARSIRMGEGRAPVARRRVSSGGRQASDSESGEAIVRQAKPGRGGRRDLASRPKLFFATRRVRVPPGKAGQQPEPSVAGVRRCASPNETPEAYTGSRQAVGMSHEIAMVVGADAVMVRGRQNVVAEWPGQDIPPGSETRACLHVGRPGTWEALPSPRQEVRMGEVNVTRRMDGRESEHLRSTEEAGEPTPRDPVEGRRVSEHGANGGKGGWEPRVPATSLRNSSG
jgi:hypothetical protein